MKFFEKLFSTLQFIINAKISKKTLLRFEIGAIIKCFENKHDESIFQSWETFFFHSFIYLQ